MFILAMAERVYNLCTKAWEPLMVMVRHPVLSNKEQSRCATMFCLTWVGFFAAIGVFTYLVSML
jgi:hypothetical protein